MERKKNKPANKQERVAGINKNTGNDNEMIGYKLYPSRQDIYNMYQKQGNIDPENTMTTKWDDEEAPSRQNEKDFDDDHSGDDLDVPGSELDDQQESVGSEDEENNYYSLGGDAHLDLDENQRRD
jgi:hypothetical protein